MLDSHDFLFLGTYKRIDDLDLGIRNLLDLIFTLLADVLGEVTGLLSLLERLDTVATAVADSHLGILACGLGLLDQFLAPFLGKRRDRASDDLAVVLRSKPEIGVDDSLLDCSDKASPMAGWRLSSRQGRSRMPPVKSEYPCHSN